MQLGDQTPMTLLAARSLRKSYRSRTVVRDLSLEIHSGEVVGLLGPNGAGKTTAFYMIVGLVPADGGSILLDERDLTALSIDQRARLGIGYLPQEASVFRKLSVADNVMAILELRAELDRADREQRLEELLEELRIGTCATRAACRCPAASAAGLKLHAHWLPNHASFCSMSHSRGSTRCPCSISSASFASWRSAASGC